MTAAEAIRRALKKGKVSQTELGRHWGTSPQVINNKLRNNQWNQAELVALASLTGGRLAFLYPDGEQILFDPPEGTEEPKN